MRKLPKGIWQGPPRPADQAPRIPSNQLAKVSHGANIEAIISTNATILRETLLGRPDLYPWIMEIDAVTIEQYCRAEARARLLNDYIMEICETKGPESVSAALWTAATHSDNVALKTASALGLSPEGRMKIVKDLGMAHHFAGATLASLIEEGASLRKGKNDEVSQG